MKASGLVKLQPKCYSSMAVVACVGNTGMLDEQGTFVVFSPEASSTASSEE